MDDNVTMNQSSAVSDILGTLMSNPDAMNMIAGVMKSMLQPQNSAGSDESDIGGTVPAVAVQSAAVAGAPNDTGQIGGISAEMMEKIPAIMSMLGPMLGQQTKNQTDGADSVPASAMGQGHNHERGQGGRDNERDHENRSKLLHALKPYLRHSRREAIDQILRITQITDLLGESGIISSHTRDESGRERDRQNFAG